MIRRVLATLICLLVPAVALAHLCNDVFQQAKDNLAVKVDVRDGQLRIGEEASFRVYLLNTMDRGIAKIALEVRTDNKFTAEVKPSPTWKGAPSLKDVKHGGKKEYFEVTLKRKPGVPDGTYKIELHLFNPGNPNQVFKTVDAGEAAAICSIPKAPAIKVDGDATAAEWGGGFSCTGFYNYTPNAKNPKYNDKVPCRDQSVVRVAADKDNLYFCMAFQGGAGARSDTASVYVAPAIDAAPVKLSVDRLSGQVTCEAGTDGVECKTDANKTTMEIKVPRKLLKVDAAKTFLANITRETTADGGETAVNYWRGTSVSVNDPVEYAQFTLAE